MKKPRIAILGATGVVGREITKISEELNVEYESIRFFSSKKSAGSKLTFKGQEYTVEEAIQYIISAGIVQPDMKQLGEKNGSV